MASVLLSTPSTGQDEVLTGLLRLGHGGQTAAALKRNYFGPRASVADIATVLVTLQGAAYVTSSAGRYTLTDTGKDRAHKKRSTRLARRRYTA